MNKPTWAFRNLRTGEVVPAMAGTHIDSPPIKEHPPDATVVVEGAGRALMISADGTKTPLRPYVDYVITPSDWMFGTRMPDGVFRPADKSVSYIIEFPAEATAELDELVKDVGDATELFKRAISLYKLARDAVHDGKAVGATSKADDLDVQFVGI